MRSCRCSDDNRKGVIMKDFSNWDYKEVNQKKASISYSNMSDNVGIKQDYSVKIPDIYANEKFISVKEHELEKILSISKVGSEKKNNWGQILINVGWATLGSYISYAVSIGKIFDSTTTTGMVGTIIMLIFSIVSFIVGYFLNKSNVISDIESCKQIRNIVEPLVKEENLEH